MINHIGEDGSHVIDHLLGEVHAGVEHGHDDALNGEVGVGTAFADLGDDLNDFGEAFESEIFALDGDEQFVRRGEGSGHEHSERRGAVENGVVEMAAGFKRGEDIADAGEVITGLGEFDFAACQFLVGTNDGEIGDAGAADDVSNGILSNEAGVEAAAILLRDAETAGGVGLGIEIDQENPGAFSGKAGG